MYDRDWARSVLKVYKMSCTRAGQIDLCLKQLYHDSRSKDLLQKDIDDFLLDSIQGKTRQDNWRMYKRLVKRTPLDKELLGNVFKRLAIKVDVEKKQRQFDFS